MKEIISAWEQDANAIPVKHDPLFSEYIEKWLEKSLSVVGRIRCCLTSTTQTSISYRPWEV